MLSSNPCFFSDNTVFKMSLLILNSSLFILRGLLLSSKSYSRCWRTYAAFRMRLALSSCLRFYSYSSFETTYSWTYLAYSISANLSNSNFLRFSSYYSVITRKNYDFLASRSCKSTFSRSIFYFSNFSIYIFNALSRFSSLVFSTASTYSKKLS